MIIDKSPIIREQRNLKDKPKVDTIKDNVNIGYCKEDELLVKIKNLRSQAGLSSSQEVKRIGQEFKTGFVTNFLDAKEVDNKLLELSSKYPALTTLVTRPYKTSGYDGKVENLKGPAPLRYLRIGNKNQDNDKKTGVLLLASPHAREVMQPMVILETVQQLLENYNPDSKDPKVKEITDLVDSLDIYVVAAENPDGLNYAIHDDPMWRKTRSKIPGTAIQGVDINRNYDYKWEPANPEKQTYSGPAPFSEPETRHVAGIVDEHPNIKFACEFHSRGNEIRKPINVTNQKDLKYFENIQKRMQDAVKSHRGMEYEMIDSDVVNGASDDYFYFKKGVYALVVEDGTEYKPEINEALGVVRECTEGAKELLRIASEYGKTEQKN